MQLVAMYKNLDQSPENYTDWGEKKPLKLNTL